MWRVGSCGQPVGDSLSVWKLSVLSLSERIIKRYKKYLLNAVGNYTYVPIPVAVRSKAWVCGRSLTRIVGSNPTGGMNVCLL